MTSMRFEDWRRPEIVDGKPTIYNWVVQHPENLVLGEGSDIGAFTYINAADGVRIGEDVEIGSHCSIYSVSTIDGKRGRVVLERGAKIGTHSVVMPGVTVGEGAVVGAFSFVTSDVPAGAVAFGVPARVQDEKQA
jgi:acetyltransferase-like isoleucine patch superfamily enzyme